MSDNRRSAPAIAANRDDSAGGYRRGRAARRGTGGGGGMAVNVVVVILIAGLALAGWFIANQHEQLAASQYTVADLQERIGRLEDRLRVTDEAMSESGADTQEKIGFWESEIRKLWDVANKRNRNWIQSNEKRLVELDKAVSALQTSQRDLNSAVSRHAEAFERQQVLEDQLIAMNLQVQQMVNGQRDLVDKVNINQQSVAGLKSGLEKRVVETERAIEAIDAYRLQVNGRLVELEKKSNITPSF